MELCHKVAINSCPWDGKSVSSACRQTALTSGSVCSYSYMKLDAVGLKDTRGLPETEPSEEFCLWKAGSKDLSGASCKSGPQHLGLQCVLAHQDVFDDPG